MDIKDKITAKLKESFANSVLEVVEFKGDLAITIDAKQVTEIAKFLKEDSELGFNLCEDVTAIDWGSRKNRFTVVYHIYSLSNNFRLRLRSNIEDDSVDSVSSVWESANWYERETFDMYGIKFKNHPDLRRMYMPEEFEYHPLRKDFPLTGIPGSLTLPKK
jgi:NADH-quinone oxidoreductase subunit C